jgi:hypothetical protein
MQGRAHLVGQTPCLVRAPQFAHDVLADECFWLLIR